MRRRNIQQHNLIRPRPRMTMRQLRRIARIDDIDELHALHHPPAANIQARNNPLGQQNRLPRSASRHAILRLVSITTQSSRAEQDSPLPPVPPLQISLRPFRPSPSTRCARATPPADPAAVPADGIPSPHLKAPRSAGPSPPASPPEPGAASPCTPVPSATIVNSYINGIYNSTKFFNTCNPTLLDFSG